MVATASLELGIDMGAVDLVCQVESPGNVARGLQRVGRAGHVVHGASKGRLIAKTPADLLESAALCRAMLDGQIEHLRVPRGCLDVLAQQVIACVAMEPWDVPALFDLVRCAYPFRDLTAEAFESVLRLVSGRFPSPGLRDLRARVAWDRIHNRLAALPGHGAPGPGRRRDDPRHGPVSRSTWATAGRGSASSTRSSSSSGGWARPSCWATRPGGSTPSSPIACWSAGPRASRR